MIEETFVDGDLVFIPDAEECYVPARVVGELVRGKKGKVRRIDGAADTRLSGPATEQVLRMDQQSLQTLEDMVELKLLNDAALLYNLRERYKMDEIYTSIGSILVSVNPYKELPLYTPDIMNEYLECTNILSMRPHIFGVAEYAYQEMIDNRLDQSVVVTGESGAGKTEATKLFLQYIAEKSRRNRTLLQESGRGGMSVTEVPLRRQILDSNPLMEAFGNAKTLRNDNSSRFGKLIDVYFDTQRRVVVGAFITSYLLEKSRVVHLNRGERNYHIFYQLCAAATTMDPELQERYGIQPAASYRYLRAEGDNNVSEMETADIPDERMFDTTRDAMRVLNLTEQEVSGIWQILAGILNLGNVTFDEDGRGYAKLADPARQSLQSASGLLGVDEASLLKACVQRDLTNNKEKVHQKHTVTEAETSRDALSKHLYAQLFDWLIVKMNEALQTHMVETGMAALKRTQSGSRGMGGRLSVKPNVVSGGVNASNIRMIGVLDIFGFESFDTNSFEQFCINYCNEKLQGFFNDHIFRQEQEEYRNEGIDVSEIGFSDNQGVIDAVENPAQGIISICDDQVWVGSRGTDKTFLEHVLKIDSKYVQQPKVQDIRRDPRLSECFEIVHYAGPVQYNVNGFLEKNRDTLRKDLRKIVAESSIPLVRKLFPFSANEEEAANGRGRGRGRKEHFRKTLGTKFREQLDYLMEKLNETNPQFVRTIKPNNEKRSDDFHSPSVLRQLREAGLLEVCKIRQQGYPVRKTHQEFFRYFLPLNKSAHDCEELCDLLARDGVLIGREWQMGETKVFMRADQADRLERARIAALENVRMMLQRAIRRFLFRNRVNKAIQARRDILAGMEDRNAEQLQRGLRFFKEQGDGWRDIEYVAQGEKLMAELRIQLEVLQELEAAHASNNVEEARVALERAYELQMEGQERVKFVEEWIRRKDLEERIRKELVAAQETSSYEDVTPLIDGLKLADDENMMDHPEVEITQRRLNTLQRQAVLVESLRSAIDAQDQQLIQNVMENLLRNEFPHDHPLMEEGQRVTKKIVMENQERARKLRELREKLQTAIREKSLPLLEEGIREATALFYEDDLVQEAKDLREYLQLRDTLFREILNASNAVVRKSKQKTGLQRSDLNPLQRAIVRAEDEGFTEDKEEEVRQGKRILALMEEQLAVQAFLAQALAERGHEAVPMLYEGLKRSQKLGLQTEDADRVAEQVRKIEALRAVANALDHREMRINKRNMLRYPTEEEKTQLRLDRLKVMNTDDFLQTSTSALDGTRYDLSMYYKLRPDEDYVENVPDHYDKEREMQLKLFWSPDAIWKSLTIMDEDQEYIAKEVNRSILGYCGEERTAFPASVAQFVVFRGLEDPALADEIYVQLCKHLRGNLHPESSDRAWQLMVMCTSNFPCSQLLLPYLLNFLSNRKSEPGLESNYARLSLAQLSSSMEMGEPIFKPPIGDIKGYQRRPPVLAQINVITGGRVDIPITPEMRMYDVTRLLRQSTNIKDALDKPEWTVFIKDTNPRIIGSRRERLIRFYREYNPERLNRVDALLEFWKDRDEELFRQLVDQYGPEPEQPIVAPKEFRELQRRRQAALMEHANKQQHQQEFFESLKDQDFFQTTDKDAENTELVNQQTVKNDEQVLEIDDNDEDDEDDFEDDIQAHGDDEEKQDYGTTKPRPKRTRTLGQRTQERSNNEAVAPERSRDLTSHGGRTHGTGTSKASTLSQIMSAPVTLAKAAGSALGLMHFPPDGIDPPPPEYSWSLPLFVYLGDVYLRMYRQGKAPELTYKRRVVRLKKKFDEQLYDQLVQEVSQGALLIIGKMNNLELAVIATCVKFLRKNRDATREMLPINSPDDLVNEGLLDFIPNYLKEKARSQGESDGKFAREAADISDLPPSIEDLQRKYYSLCKRSPCFGMVYFSAIWATEEDPIKVTVGVNQQCLSLIHEHEIVKSYPLQMIKNFKVATPRYFVLFIRLQQNQEGDENQARRQSLDPFAGPYEPRMSRRDSGIGNTLQGSGAAVKRRTRKLLKSMGFTGTEVVGLVTIQAWELYEILYLHKHDRNRNRNRTARNR